MFIFLSDTPSHRRWLSSSDFVNKRICHRALTRWLHWFQIVCIPKYWGYVNPQFKAVSLSRAKRRPALTLKTIRVETQLLSDMLPEVLVKWPCLYRDLVAMHSGLMSLGWGLRVCISNMFPGDDRATGLWTTLWAVGVCSKFKKRCGACIQWNITVIKKEWNCAICRHKWTQRLSYSEISQKAKNKYHITLLICGIWRRGTRELICKAEIEISV